MSKQNAAKEAVKREDSNSPSRYHTSATSKCPSHKITQPSCNNSTRE